MFFKKTINFLLLLFLFLLPWQTRYIWHYGSLNGSYFEYGSFSLYATELILWAALLIFFFTEVLGGKIFLGALGRGVKEHKITAAWFGFLFLLLVFSAVRSKSPFLTYYNIFRILEGMALLALLLFYKNRKFLWAFWAGAVLQGVLAVFQFFTQYIPAGKWLGWAQQDPYRLGAGVIEIASGRWLRAYGSFGWPNSLGIYLAAALITGFLIYKNINGCKRLIVSAGQIFISAGLLFSFSRGAWLAAFAGFAALLIFTLAKKEPLAKISRQFGFTALVFLAGVFLFFPLFSGRFDFANRLEEKSMGERALQLVQWTGVVKNNLGGVGPGGYVFALFQMDSSWSAWQYQPIHNIFLLMITELGAAGFLLFSVLFGFLAAKIAKQNLIFLALPVVLLVAGLFDHFLWSLYGGMMIFWAVWGLAFSSED